MTASSKKVAALYMGLKIEEVGTEIRVSGPYPAIQPYLSKLKKMKFRYNGSDKTWSHPLTPRLNEKILSQKLFGSAKDQEKKTKEEEARKEELTRFLDAFPKNFKSIQISSTSGGLTFSGDTYPLRDAFRDAGAKWDSGYKRYVLNAASTSLGEAQSLLTTVQRADAQFLAHQEKVISLIKNFKEPGVTLSVKGDQMILNFETRIPFRLDSFFDYVRRHGTGFTVPLREVTKSDLDNMAAALSKSIADTRRETLRKNEEKLRKEEENTRLGIKLFHGLHPYKVGEVFETRQGAWTVVEVQKPVWMDEEDAMSFGIMNMNRSGYVYYASARPATEEEMEEAGILKRRQERVDAKRIAEAITSLRDLIQKYGNIPPGKHLKLPKPFYEGNKRLQIYGGGYWFVRDGNHVWYVQNNGADGDAWERNNITTGGAGAIGWKANIIPEMEPLIALLTATK